MFDEEMTTGELLEQWREATRAAELAERLAKLARASVERSDRDAAAAQEIAKMAERAAVHAERTARVARDAANRALAFATMNRSRDLEDAEAAVSLAHADEAAARDRYHEAARLASERQRDEP